MLNLQYFPFPNVLSAQIIFFRVNQVQSRVTLGMIGVLSVALSIGMGYGLAAGFGVPFTSLQQVLPFILVGIGVDDVFVLSNGMKVGNSKVKK